MEEVFSEIKCMQDPVFSPKYRYKMEQREKRLEKRRAERAERRRMKHRYIEFVVRHEGDEDGPLWRGRDLSECEDKEVGFCYGRYSDKELEEFANRPVTIHVVANAKQYWADYWTEKEEHTKK